MITLLLVGDDPLARSTLASAAARAGDIVVLEERELARGAEATAADVVLLDLGLETRAALDRARGWMADVSPLVVLIRDEEAAPELLASGARAVLFRGADAGQLAAAIRGAAEGLVVLAPEIADRLRESRAERAPQEIPALTPREREVLELLALGLLNKQIADRLGISDHTVKFHVNAITQKLGAQSRTDAVVRAARLGLILL